MMVLLRLVNKTNIVVNIKERHKGETIMTMTTNKVSLNDLLKHSTLTYEPHTLLSTLKQSEKIL